MYRKEFNDKLTEKIVEVLGHIIHDDYAQFVDPSQIKKNLSRVFKANEWEEEYIFDDIVEKLVTARRALWHIRARNVSGQNSKDRKNSGVWEGVPDDEKEEWK
ncbi:uncharacterized protein METZ01_LOCUS256402 [marine metagenome]|uniref:Uncharacterized protein n=1 Tax=marine metagenome TaxID=408172 RepID=A0A382IVH7_9ZZZZ